VELVPIGPPDSTRPGELALYLVAHIRTDPSPATYSPLLAGQQPAHPEHSQRDPTTAEGAEEGPTAVRRRRVGAAQPPLRKAQRGGGRFAAHWPSSLLSGPRSLHFSPSDPERAAKLGAGAIPRSGCRRGKGRESRRRPRPALRQRPLDAAEGARGMRVD
jgi:hypothetical protein